MATLSSSLVVNDVSPKAIYGGLTTNVVEFNSGSTVISTSATTVELMRVPNKCWITRVYVDHSSGAASSPMDIGVDTSLSAFASAVTQGAGHVCVKGLPFRVSLTDTAEPQYVTVKATVTPGTATASVKINAVVEYQMD